MEDLRNKVVWPYRHDMLVGDYFQNLDLPHFGGEQPGDTYYFSPLTINGFGVVDYSIEELNSYIYTEAEGKKGGNNVVSLLSNTLQKKGVFEDAERLGPGKALTGMVKRTIKDCNSFSINSIADIKNLINELKK